jgi:hypothetical protein
MPWFRIVAVVAAMEPSLFMPARIKIRAISRRPSAEMDDTSAFISEFITYSNIYRLVLTRINTGNGLIVHPQITEMNVLLVAQRRLP